MKTQPVQLGEVCDFVYGEALKEENRRSGTVPVYGSNGVVGLHDRAVTRGATIVIGRKGSIGEVNWSNGPCFPIDTTYYVDETKKPCDLRWLYYTLLKLDLTRLNKSAAVPGLNREDAYEQRIPFPDVPEQERIAARLDQADRLRRTRRYALELTDTFLPATFLKIFGDPTSNGHSWTTDILDNCCERFVDYRGRTPEYSTEGIPHVTATCIKEHEIQWTAARRVTEGTYAAYMTRGLPVRGDVIFTTEAPLGETAVIKTDERFSMAQRLLLIRPGPALLPDYLCHLLSHGSFRSQLLRFSTGSTVKGISSENFRAIPIPLPPLPLQQRFATEVERSEHLRLVEREALRQAEHLFASLLHRAFSG